MTLYTTVVYGIRHGFQRHRGNRRTSLRVRTSWPFQSYSRQSAAAYHAVPSSANDSIVRGLSARRVCVRTSTRRTMAATFRYSSYRSPATRPASRSSRLSRSALAAHTEAGHRLAHSPDSCQTPPQNYPWVIVPVTYFDVAAVRGCSQSYRRDTVSADSRAARSYGWTQSYCVQMH